MHALTASVESATLHKETAIPRSVTRDVIEQAWRKKGPATDSLLRPCGAGRWEPIGQQVSRSKPASCGPPRHESEPADIRLSSQPSLVSSEIGCSSTATDCRYPQRTSGHRRSSTECCPNDPARTKAPPKTASSSLRQQSSVLPRPAPCDSMAARDHDGSG